MEESLLQSRVLFKGKRNFTTQMDVKGGKNERKFQDIRGAFNYQYKTTRNSQRIHGGIKSFFETVSKQLERMHVLIEMLSESLNIEMEEE